MENVAPVSAHLIVAAGFTTVVFINSDAIRLNKSSLKAVRHGIYTAM